MAGLKVVAVKTHLDGNLDLEDLKSKAEDHKDNLAAFMACTSYFFILILSDAKPDHLPFNFRSIRSRRARCNANLLNGSDYLTSFFKGL